MQQNLPLDTVLSFCGEKIPGHGEDSYCYCFCDTAGLLGVFDGCGGAGAKIHDAYSGHTEAYIASRLCSGAFFDSFRRLFPGQPTVEQMIKEAFLPEAVGRLKTYSPLEEEGTFRMKGSMIRTLPTTAAAAVVQPAGKGELTVHAIWAGDSRVYVLDSKGLAQLTVDDTTVPDPMENIYEDGILRNVFCSDKPVKLHCNTVRLHTPFMVFAVTDGCFGYVSTPMEFEGLLLHTLLNSKSAAQWEEQMEQVIKSIAGDDHTMCMGAFGYGSFPAMKKSLAKRYTALTKQYLKPVSQLPLEDRQSRFALWEQYRTEHMRYIKDGQE